MSRSKWKFNYLAQDFISQNQNQDLSLIKELVLQDRATYITAEMVGTIVRVYNGMKYFNLHIEADKVGYRVGEFAPTKKKAVRKKKVKVVKKK